MIKIKPCPAKVVQGILLTVSFCCLLGSCAKVEVGLDSDFVDNNTTNLVMVDSATLEISTIYVDSFITSGGGSILAGSYSDPLFGKVVSGSFIQLGVPSGFSIPNGAVFDSLEVILTLNKTYYGDTLTPYAISIHQLTEPIKLPTDQYSFYNNNKRSYNAAALGSTRLIIRPSTRDTISIRISQSLGQQLFDKMFNSDEVVTNNTQFVDFFKGLAIVDGGGNNLIVGFKDSLTMRLHYRNPGVITTDAQVDFFINDNANQFNNISVNRTGTPIAALGAGNKQIFSTQSQNAGFSQYISGAMVKIRFPYLRDLLQLNDFVKIIRADLVIRPVKNSFLQFYTLPPYLRLSATDQYNNPGTDLSAYSSASGASGIQYGNLFIDNLYGTNTAYSYDITTYLQEQIVKTDNNKNGVLVLPPDPAQIFNRVLIGNKHNAESKTEVKIYYATIK
ncbi:MAG: DUF4270 family protein [Ferruginibacter sp.]|nr:DUF4270 family protein [Ferruginibacter sp.]